MAGSSMAFTYDGGSDGFGGFGGVKKITATWTSDSSSGAASGITAKIAGRLIKGITVPGAGGAAPTDNYDINITDEQSVDVLAGCKKGLADRDTANTEEQYFMLLNNDTSPLSMALQPVVCSTLTIAVTNAGNSKTGTIVLYYAPSA